MGFDTSVLERKLFLRNNDDDDDESLSLLLVQKGWAVNAIIVH